MTKPKEKTIEELTAEIAANERKIQQYKNRKKIITQQISRETRKERNHRIFLYGGFLESIVPELKTMTEDECKDFLYHIAKSSEAKKYLKERADGVEAG